MSAQRRQGTRRSVERGARAPRSRRSASRPLLRLLGYLRRHRKYATLTLIFGACGFLLSFSYPWIIGNAVDLVVSQQLAVDERQARLADLTKLAAGSAVLHAIVVYGRGHFNVHLGNGIVSDLRRELFDHLQRLSVGFYTRTRTGSVLSRVLHDVHAATTIIYGGIIVVVLDAAQLLLSFTLLCAISWKLTAACLLVLPLYGVVFATMNPRVRKASERVDAHFSELAGYVSERLAGQSLIKTYTAEQREGRRFARDLDRHHRLVLAQSHAGHRVASYGEVLVHLGTTVVVGYGGWLALYGELSAGTLTRFLGYTLALYGPVRRFAELNIMYQSSLSAMRRVFRVLEIEPAIRDAPRPRREPPRVGEVRLEQVRFRFGQDESKLGFDQPRSAQRDPSQAPWVLDGVSLYARPGQRVAIVGPSGAGKTTLLSLVPRLHDVCEGRVLLDGVDVRDYSLHALRSAIAIVQQDSLIFSGTVRDNLRYGKVDASDEEIVAAARAANAHDFISAFPDGYATQLGERGVNLSGGERQRISIARAMLKDPRVLILDEATSSLDAESEAIVQRALERLMRDRTSFIIAHRLSTIRDADCIFLLEHGRIAQRGTHAELMASNGTYARLVARQGAL